MEKRASKSWLVAGVLFICYALVDVLAPVMCQYVWVNFSVLRWLYIGSYIVLGITFLLSKKIKFLPIVGLGVYLIYDLATGVYGLIGIVDVISTALFLFVFVVFLTELLPGCRTICKKLWYIPVILVGVVSYLTFNFGFLIHVISRFAIGDILFGLADLYRALGFLFAMMWVVFPEGMPRKEKIAATDEQGEIACVQTNYGFCNMTKHVLLLLFTCGVWMYIWIFKTTNFTNGATGEEQRNPVSSMLLCMFVPFYSIFWTYKTAQRVDKMAAEKGVQSDLATLCLILAIVFGILPPILLQDKINSIVTA